MQVQPLPLPHSFRRTSSFDQAFPKRGRAVRACRASALVALLLGAMATSAARTQCPPDWVALPSMSFSSTTSFNAHPFTLRVLPSGDLLAGGSFTAIGAPYAVNANRIARYDGANWTGLGSGIGSGIVYATEVMSNGDLIVGGTFGTAGGNPATNIARWDGASWHALGNGVGGSNGAVRAIAALANGDLIAGGAFTAGGAPVNGLARWDGSAWSNFGPPGLSSVRAMAILPNGDLVVGCESSPLGPLMVWNGSTWTSLGGVSGGPVYSLLVEPSGELWVGGEFTSAGGQPTNCVASWNGAAWTAYPNGPQSPSSFYAPRVTAMTLDAAGDLVVGGRFSLVGSASANTVAKWDGASWSGFGSGPMLGNGPSEVSCVASTPGSVWAGGPMTGGLKRWTCPTGLADFGFNGNGCGYGRRSFLESFGSSFDLANSTLRMTRTSLGYSVSYLSGAPVFHTPAPGSQLALTDDSVSAPLPLPFNLSYPGGSTNQVLVGSNGFVYLQPSVVAAPFYNQLALFLGGDPRLAAIWGDLDPASGTGSGTIHFDLDASNQVAYATWQGVQEWANPWSLCTFQIAMFASGDVEYRYQACSSTLANGALTGWTPGGGALDPGSRDLNNAPFTFTTDPIDLERIQQGVMTRPVLNTAWTLETRSIANTAVLGLEILGLSNPNVPDLSAIGMPFCGLYASLDALTPFFPSGPTHTFSIAIPGSTSLIGIHVYATSATWVGPPGGPYSLITANGVDGLIGNP